MDPYRAFKSLIHTHRTVFITQPVHGHHIVAPLKTGHRTGPRKAKKWLSPEAVDAKKHRRIGSSGDGRLPTQSLTALPIGLLARLQTS